jgi:hypothetical protein
VIVIGPEPQFVSSTGCASVVVATSAGPTSTVDGVALTPGARPATASEIVLDVPLGMSVVMANVEVALPAAVGAAVALNITVFPALPSTETGNVGAVIANGASGVEIAVTTNDPAWFAIRSNICVALWPAHTGPKSTAPFGVSDIDVANACAEIATSTDFPLS